MAKYTRYKSWLSALLTLPFCILCVCCQGSLKDDHKRTISESYKFTSDVTSVNLYDSILYLGLYSDQFVKFDPRNGDSKSYKLPSRLNNTQTYYIYPLSADSFLVSKRNYGVTLVYYTKQDGCTQDSAISLRQDSVHKPFKGENYSSYNIYPFMNSLLVGSTNGLMIMPRKIDSDTLKFVSSLARFRDEITQYTIEDICGVNADEIDVYTKDTKWTFKNSTADTTSTSLTYANEVYKRCFDSWYLSNKGDTLKYIGADHERLYYLGGLDISTDKGAKVAILDSTLYYVSGKKLHSVYLPSLRLLNRSDYDPLAFVAKDTTMMYMANSSGLYSVNPVGNPEYMHAIEDVNGFADGIVHNKTIYTIDKQSLYEISPKNRYSFAPIKPVKIFNIIEEFADNAAQEDELKCIDINNDIIYIGSRNSIYRYDLTENAIDTTKLKKNDTTDNFINPYFTTISFPYAGTLNDGIHLIDGNQSKRLLSGPKDIRKLVYKMPYLACKTNDNVSLYRHKKNNIENLEIDTIPHINETILDIALTNDSLYLLCPEKLISISLSDDSINTKSNPGYTYLANLGQKIIPYSNLSVVDGHVLEPNPVDWRTYFFIALIIILLIALIILLIVLLIKHIELQSRRKNPEYHSAKDIVVKFTKSNDCKDFMAAPIPAGYAGELRRQMRELLNTVISTSVENENEVIVAKRQLVELSKIIFGRFVELSSNLTACRDTIDRKLAATNSIKTKNEAESFLNKIIEIINNLKWSSLKLKDIDIIRLSISIIERLEMVYSEINNQMKVSEIQVLAEEVICQDNTENAEDLADFLIIDKALISSLLLKQTGRSVFFWEKPDDYDPGRFKYENKFNYMWNGFLLLTLTNIESTKIKKYLNYTFFPIFGNEDEESAKERKKNWDEYSKQLMVKVPGPIVSFFNGRVSQDVWERESFIPTMPMDLVLISSIRFNDKRMQLPDKTKV